MKLAEMQKTNLEIHNIIEALIFNEDRNDYSPEEYQEAYNDIVVEEVPQFNNVYLIHTTDKRYLYEYVKITKNLDHTLCMIFETISDECIVILDNELKTIDVIY